MHQILECQDSPKLNYPKLFDFHRNFAELVEPNRSIVKPDRNFATLTEIHRHFSKYFATLPL